MLNKLIKITIFVFVCRFAYADGGFFMGLGAGYASLNNSLQGNYVFNNGSGGTQNSNNPASTFFIGYDYNRFIGLEGDYNVAYASNVAGSYNINQQLLGLSIVGHLPFGIFSDSLSRFALLGKVGLDYNVATFTNASTNCNNCINPPNYYPGYTPIYGLGLEFAVTDNIGIRGEWNYQSNLIVANQDGTQMTVSSNLYLISAVYHF